MGWIEDLDLIEEVPIVWVVEAVVYEVPGETDGGLWGMVEACELVWLIELDAASVSGQVLVYELLECFSL